MRKHEGTIYGFEIVSDPDCPKDRAYLMPDELVVPPNTKITKAIRDFVKGNKDKIGVIQNLSQTKGVEK